MTSVCGGDVSFGKQVNMWVKETMWQPCVPQPTFPSGAVSAGQFPFADLPPASLWMPHRSASYYYTYIYISYNAYLCVYLYIYAHAYHSLSFNAKMRVEQVMKRTRTSTSWIISGSLETVDRTLPRPTICRRDNSCRSPCHTDSIMSVSIIFSVYGVQHIVILYYITIISSVKNVCENTVMSCRDLNHGVFTFPFYSARLSIVYNYHRIIQWTIKYIPSKPHHQRFPDFRDGGQITTTGRAS